MIVFISFFFLILQVFNIKINIFDFPVFHRFSFNLVHCKQDNIFF